MAMACFTSKQWPASRASDGLLHEQAMACFTSKPWSSSPTSHGYGLLCKQAMAMVCFENMPWPWPALQTCHGHGWLCKQAMTMDDFASKPWPWPALQASHGHGLLCKQAMAMACFASKPWPWPLKDPPDGWYFWRVPGYLVLFCQNSCTWTRTWHPLPCDGHPPMGAGYPPAGPLGNPYSGGAREVSSPEPSKSTFTVKMSLGTWVPQNNLIFSTPTPAPLARCNLLAERLASCNLLAKKLASCKLLAKRVAAF
ncbi:hypothetical protein PCANC_19003 [Puccinia coronata f. sp. avenae]|uniref:Uncharacterized protein n=1 Tax=Puccinia coronata f. sp. avenae TaxID=200324 RepID=A0A2N5UHD0_9BASI|nr:hypothetical protein PCANC_19003 [Puccinia coronata f. sp. avenae]